MSKYSYQTLVVPRALPAKAAPNTRGNAVGAGVELMHKAAVALNSWAVSYRATKELERMGPRIDQAIRNYEERLRASRPDVGVLVCISIQEWEIPDATGNRAQSFLSAYIAGVGTRPDQVFQKHRNTPTISQGPAKGWRKRDTFVWVTRNA